MLEDLAHQVFQHLLAQSRKRGRSNGGQNAETLFRWMKHPGIAKPIMANFKGSSFDLVVKKITMFRIYRPDMFGIS